MSRNRSRLTEHANQSMGGYELVFAVVAFGAIGFWIDSLLGSTPWLTIACTVLGFVGAGLGIYYRYKAEIARLQDESTELRAEAKRRELSGEATP